MCNHTGELHEFDEVGTYCLICETYEQSIRTNLTITLKNNIALEYLMSENDKKDVEEAKRDNEMSTDVITSDKLVCEVCHRDFPTRTAYENHGCINQIFLL